MSVEIIKVLTYNGSQFMDRLTASGKKNQPYCTYVFDRLCKQLGIEHRFIPPRHLQKNGMVERFSGRISTSSTIHASVQPLNWNRRCAITSRFTITAFRNERSTIKNLSKHSWADTKRSELFRKRVYNQTGFDT